MNTNYILLENTIKAIIKKDKQLNISDIAVDVLEILMKLERDNYLINNPNPSNKANGFYTRFINSLSYRILLRVPRDRLGSFYPFLLEVAKKEKLQLDEFALRLYARGLSQRDIADTLKELYGLKYSASNISKLVKELEPYRKRWQSRRLEKDYHVVMIDAMYVSVRREGVEKEAVYFVIGLNREFKREIIGLYSLPRESVDGWDEVFQDLSKRGMERIGLVLCDELSGIKKAIYNNYPSSRIQHCLVHKMRQLKNGVRSSKKLELISDFKEVFDIERENDSREELEERLESFIEKWSKSYPSMRGKIRKENVENYSNYLCYPILVRRMLYTTNWIERLNKEMRKVIRHVNSFPNEASMLNLLYMVGQKMEEKVYCYPITSFYSVREVMEKILTPQTQFS